MDRLEALLGHLPSLYRPQPDDPGLLGVLLGAAAGALADAEGAAGELLATRWLDYADAARFEEFFGRGRQLAGRGPADPADPEDRRLLETYPHVRHLARLAALLDLPPCREPAALREPVEDYRRRLRRTVALYREGLGTVAAMRRMVEARLPRDPEAPPALSDRPFWIEEGTPLVTVAATARTAGAPDGVVGPLMRFTLDADAAEPTPPTVYVDGLAAEPDRLDATVDPAIERFEGAGGPPLAIGFRGTVEPGLTLRLRPAYSSWLTTPEGLLRADADPGDGTGADPAAPGPWSPAARAPEGAAVALHQSHDRALWLAVERAGAGELWRFDGAAWTRVLDGLAPPTLIAEAGDELVVGTADGLVRVGLYPAGGAFAAGPPVLAGRRILAATPDVEGRLWLGTDQGIERLPAGGEPAPFVLGAGGRFATAVHAISSGGGSRFFGCDLGLFRFETAGGAWHWYSGQEPGDRAPEWASFFPDLDGAGAGFPEPGMPFLPPVLSIARGPDGSLWLGTARGLARYRARPLAGGAFTTRLEAYPELGTGPVTAAARDPHGLLWFATDRGLLRFDGRDFWQHGDGSWQRLGDLDAGSDDRDRGAWRFFRESGAWERFDRAADAWAAPAPEPVTVTAEAPAVTGFAWSDRAVADLGTRDAATGEFSGGEPVPEGSLVMRVKPEPTRIADGGVPALPRVPAGRSTWRYLRLEPEQVEVPPAEQLPAWTVEGRLLPPPPGRHAPPEARFDVATPPPAREFDASVFAFPPAARVGFEWRPRRPFAALVRLARRTPGEAIDPAVLDRVWQGIEKVRPAGVHVLLAVEDDIVRGT